MTGRSRNDGKPSSAAARRERLAAELRANLARRKAQARERKAETADGAPKEEAGEAEREP